MKLNNFTPIINQSLYQVLKKIRKIYLNSTIYDKRISSKNLKALTYKPSLKILGSIAKYEKTKNKIEDFETDKIWDVDKLSYKKVYLHPKFCLFQNLQFYFSFFHILRLNPKFLRKVYKLML